MTLLGDAAHLTGPNGEGANLAMYDAAELGRAIAAHSDDMKTALTEYEQAMFPRSAASAAEQPDLHEVLGDDTPQNLMNKFAGN